MAERLLLEVGAAVDPVQHLQRAADALAAVSEAVGQPVPERARLLDEPEPEQREHRERGVADPCVAVVPVPLAADDLRQARRRRGDEGAGRPVGQELQRQRRTHHHLAPPPAVRRAREPATPVVDRPGEEVAPVLLGARVRRRALLEHERRALARGERELSADAELGLLERDSARQRKRQARRRKNCAPLDQLALRPLAAVVEARLDLDAEADLAPHAEHAPDQLLPVAPTRSSTGMKSRTSPIPSCDENRVIRTFVSGT